MKRLASIALCVSLASAGLLGSTGSTFAAPAPASSAVGSATETFKQRAERSISDAAVSEAVKATFRAVVAELPDDADQRVARLNAKLGIKDTQWAGIAGSVINPADTNPTMSTVVMVEEFSSAVMPAPASRPRKRLAVRLPSTVCSFEPAMVLSALVSS